MLKWRLIICMAEAARENFRESAHVELQMTVMIEA
jgi:hypothetical protein